MKLESTDLEIKSKTLTSHIEILKNKRLRELARILYPNVLKEFLENFKIVASLRF